MCKTHYTYLQARNKSIDKLLLSSFSHQPSRPAVILNSPLESNSHKPLNPFHPVK